MRDVMRYFLLGILCLGPALLTAQTPVDTIIRGADISFTPQIEDLGGKYKLHGVEMDALDILKQNGANYIRLRIWHTPANGYCGLAKTLAYAMRVKARGYKLLLDFHYSDWWADPGKQNKPAAWVGIPFAALRDSMYAYTRDVVAAMKNQNTLPDMVQIGNEITAGMLWNDGRVGGTYDTPQQWANFADLVNEGIRGAREAASDTAMKIMIHIDRGGDNTGARWFYDKLKAQGVQFDVIGLSYYPWWHGSLTQLKNNLNDLAARYDKDLVLAETAYPWTTQSLNDGMGNIGVDAAKLPAGYAKSPQGQKAFLSAITKILKETNNNKGRGFFYWEPAYISKSPIGSSWEHLTTFDFNGNALSSITSFMNLDSVPKVTVTMRFNTATNTDTLKPGGVVQVLGEILGLGSGLLPSGELLTWDSYSQIKPRNTGGDYWEYQCAMHRGDSLEFKLWTGHTSTTPTFPRLGWEGPTAPFNGLRLIIAGSGDTVLPVQYYNSSGLTVDQYWSPVPPKQDSVGILFRVNMATLMNAGIFEPAVHGPVTVRGDSSASAGILSWSSSRVVLARETTSVANGSFWSGVCYFPKALIAPATQVKYKFYVEHSIFGGWEFNISDRTLAFPPHDTTLAWRFFNERLAVTSAGEVALPLPDALQLFQNFPNPFNPTTVIRYQVPALNGADGPAARKVRLVVYDILGRKVRTLVDDTKPAGAYSIGWDGLDDEGLPLVSGTYVARLEAGGDSRTTKMILLR
jgi:arabinogalactan endo-1,4-beta-galactosidase